MSRILIIEDEKKIARFIELELTHEGYEVQAAYDGRAGLSLADSWKPDLLILDLMLPELSGIEVCRRLRQHSDVPIIMLTAKDDVSDKVMGLDMGADDYITKPFAIEELLARIRVCRKADPKRRQLQRKLWRSAGIPDQEGVRSSALSVGKRPHSRYPRRSSAQCMGIRFCRRYEYCCCLCSLSAPEDRRQVRD